MLAAVNALSFAVGVSDADMLYYILIIKTEYRHLGLLTVRLCWLGIASAELIFFFWIVAAI